MALPTNRNQLKEFCLRKLGKGVIKINVSDQQIEDRIDEAVHKFQEFHIEGTEEVYIGKKLTASLMTLSNVTGSQWLVGSTIYGETSGAKTKIESINSSTSLNTFETTETFIPGETVTCGDGTASLTSLVYGDYDNHYITVESDVIAVTDVLCPNSFAHHGEFSPMREMFRNQLYKQLDQGLSSFFISRMYVATIENIAGNQLTFTFNRVTRQLRVLADWNNIGIGGYVVYRAEKVVDPNAHAKFYSEEWLIHYTTALIQEQWGLHLSKYKGVEMLGGVQLDGDFIANQAKEKIQQLEDDLEKKYTKPIGFIVG